MAELFFKEGRSGRENAEKCVRLFIDRFNNGDTTSIGFPSSQDMNKIAQGCASLISFCLGYPSQYVIPNVLVPLFSMMKGRLIEKGESMAKTWAEIGGIEEALPFLHEATRYVKAL